MTEQTPTVTLPKGIKQEEYDKAKLIIVSGYEAKQDADTIKTAMFENGIPFSNLLRLFKAITVAEKLVISPKEIKDGIGGYLKKVKFKTLKDWTSVEPLVKHIMGQVKGATEKKIMAALRTKMNELELECPKKPKRSGGDGPRTSKINVAIVDLFAGNKEASAEDFAKALGKVTTEKSLKKWNRLYKTFSAIAQGLTAEKGLAVAVEPSVEESTDESPA